MEKKENSWYQPQKRVKSRIKACTTAGNLVRQAKSIFFSLSIQGKKKRSKFADNFKEQIPITCILKKWSK